MAVCIHCANPLAVEKEQFCSAQCRGAYERSISQAKKPVMGILSECPWKAQTIEEARRFGMAICAPCETTAAMYAG